MGCGPACFDKAFRDEPVLPCAAVHSPECLRQWHISNPYYVYIPAPCARHLGSMVEDATDRWYDAWESKLTNHPLDHNVLRVKSAILEPSVRRHIEPWMTWWQQKLFADHAQFVRNRINWVKANLGVKQPRERFSDLDVKFSLDVGQAIAFFCGEYLHVRTPLHPQWTAVSSVFINPYQAEKWN
jgi:hypothetical protein